MQNLQSLRNRLTNHTIIEFSALEGTLEILKSNPLILTDEETDVSGELQRLG